MASSSGLLKMPENYILPSSNSSKPFQYLVEVIGLDHCYSKPWSSQQRVPNPRPVKMLFLRDAQSETEPSKTKKANDNKLNQEEMLIDVDSIDGGNSCGPNVINMQYDVAKSRVAMGECEKYVSSVSSRRTPDTWEELICRTGWTNQQNVLFDKILRIVSSYRLARLTYEGSANEPILRRVALDKATKTVRQILSRIEWDSKLTTWLHSSLVDGLSVPLLASYLDILQTLRSKVPTLVDKMIASSTSHRRVSPGTTDNMTSLLKRPWEAAIGLSSFQRQRKVSGPPLLLIVPSGPTTNSTGNTSKRSRFWHHHLSNLGKVIPVTMHLSNSGRGVSVGQCLDHMIGAVQAKVLELKSHFPNRPVVLIGWSTGALVSFQVSLAEPVCAVVCLGFPLLGVDGLRGEADDSFLECKTPTMFVFGTLSSCCALPDIEEFRKKLLADTSLLVIGGADDQLRLTCSKKKMEGVTQTMVDRRIMDEIGEFLGNAVSVMHSVQNRTDYFDFDDIENRRKKPKNEKRKRPAATGTSSAADGDTAKKPKTKATKPATPRGQGNITKKPKVTKNVKRPPANKQVVLTPGTTLVPGPPSLRTLGSLPLATLQNTHPTISAGIIQRVRVPFAGVNVPISGVNVPISGVNVPISRVNVPIAGVNVPLSRINVPISGINVPISGVSVSNVSMPVSGVKVPVSGVNVPVSGVNVPVCGVNVPVSAVIKQGSLGGRPFVFSCPQATNTNVSPASPGTLSSGAVKSDNGGITPPLKTVTNSSPATVTKVPGQQNPAAVTSSVQQPSPQYKSSVVSSPSLPKSMPSTATSAGTRTSSGPVSTNAATTVAKQALTALSMTLSNVTHKQVSAASPSTAKRTAGSQSVVSASNTKSAAIPTSGQAQFIMRKGQLSAITKPSNVRVSSPTNPNQIKSVPGSQTPRGVTPTNGKSKQSSTTTTTDSSATLSVVRVSPAGSSQGATTLVRKTPLPQSVTRTIQVGVKDPKKPMMTKRTVTYTPTIPTKTVNVVSRSGPSSALTGMVARSATSGKTNNVLDVGKRLVTTQPTRSQVVSAQSPQSVKKTSIASSLQAKYLQRSGAQLVSASLASARSLNAHPASSLSSLSAQKASTQSGSASSSLSGSQTARSIARYHDDEKLVEKIRGIVKDVVNSTPRSAKHGARQRIVVTTISTAPSELTSAVTTATRVAAEKKPSESSEEKNSTDENSKK